jgi:hypothetical protein
VYICSGGDRRVGRAPRALAVARLASVGAQDFMDGREDGIRLAQHPVAAFPGRLPPLARLGLASLVPLCRVPHRSVPQGVECRKKSRAVMGSTEVAVHA